MTTSIDDDGSSEDTPRLSVLPVDYDFLETFDLEVSAGRSFAAGRTSDVEEAVILNESAVEAYGLGDSPVGRTVEVESDRQRTVIGIVKDFHNPSLHHQIQPLAFTLRPENNYTGILRLAGGDITTGLAAVRSVWQQFRPDRPFIYQFISQRIERNYQAEQRLGQIFGIFAGLAIFLACLGLFGLAAFSAQQRTQEIGIRKVLGATVAGIVGLLSKDFLKLVSIALTIAVPVGYILMQRWLENFAYRIELGPTVFLLAGGIALGIAFFTVSYQSIKAALTNPAESLRYE